MTFGKDTESVAAGNGENNPRRIAVIGAGFTGLSAAYELSRAGCEVTVMEAQNELGGLARGFRVGGTRLESFYHHWFTNDVFLKDLVRELGREDQIVQRPTATGMFFAGSRYRLSTPLDVLKFSPLSLWNRIRLGLLVLRARRQKDWRELDHLTAAEWLKSLAGPEVYRVVWEPLLVGKFGEYANDISAAWFWSKLALRGGSRGKGGRECLVYYRGGFAALADHMADAIRQSGGRILLQTPATGLRVDNNVLTGVETPDQVFDCDNAILTPALPIIADLIGAHAPVTYIEGLRSIGYLGNICLILILDRSLTDLYWTNVNDPDFPFVGIIEHTNFEPPESYDGRHVVYMSKYLTGEHEMNAMSDARILEFSLPYIKRMFPEFSESWIMEHHVWRARYAQPLATCHYTERIPGETTPVSGLHISTMAQIYPEDRGTNYAIRNGRRLAKKIVEGG